MASRKKPKTLTYLLRKPKKEEDIDIDIVIDTDTTGEVLASKTTLKNL